MKPLPFFAMLAAVFLLAGCATAKVKALLQEGALSKKDFREELSYEDRNGMIILPVEIGGKTRHFLLDTGAPNLITSELAQELGLKAEAQFSVGDSQGKARKLSFVRIDSMTISGLTFFGTGAIVSDLDEVVGLRCLDVDGFIGANLLKHTFLQIDYAAQKVVMASSLDSLSLPASGIRWPFQVNAQGSPELMLQISGISFGSLTLDTGSSGWVDLPRSAYWKVRSAGPLSGRRTYGVSSAGLYGEGKADTLYRAWISRVTIGDSLELPPVSVDFSGPKNHRIGNAFWRQFTLTIDWQARQLHLAQGNLASVNDFHTFGFRPVFRDGQLQAGFVWEDSPADKQGLRPGDRILFMNGLDCINFSERQYCQIWLNDQLEQWEKLDLFIEQDGATKRLELEQEAFFRE